MTILTAIQFNFPDHTKLLVSKDGNWIEFTHFPANDAMQLARTGVFRPGCLERRSSISQPTTWFKACLNDGEDATDQKPWKALVENHFPLKLEWVRRLVALWVKNGSLGSLARDEEESLVYEGVREKPKDPEGNEDLVWVSLGNPRGGDAEYRKTYRKWSLTKME